MAGKIGAVGKIVLMGLTAALIDYTASQAQPNFNNISQNKNDISLKDFTKTSSVNQASLAAKVKSLVDIVETKGNISTSKINGKEVSYKEYGVGSYILQNFDNYFVIVKRRWKQDYVIADYGKDGTADAYVTKMPKLDASSVMEGVQNAINAGHFTDASHAITDFGETQNAQQMGYDNIQEAYTVALLEVEGTLQGK